MINQNGIVDVVIVGAGMVGMSLAVGLARSGVRVAVLDHAMLDRQVEPAFDGRVSAISYGSSCILKSIGVWEDVAGHAEPIRDIRVSDGRTPFFLHYDHRELHQAGKPDVPFGYIVENRHLRLALHRQAKQLPTLHLVEGESPAVLEREASSVRVRTKNNITIKGRLLVAADGKHSVVRSLAGIETVESRYGQTAIVTTIAHEKPHKGLAQERFLPAGAFAVLPMQGNHSSLVWVEPDERVHTYLALDEAEFAQEITERIGDCLGDIQVVGARFSYPLTVMHACTYVQHRLALIGDAAHAIHPLAGQGVNLGLRDVGVLLELIAKPFGLGLDIGSDAVLQHYQRWRRFDAVTMIAVTDGLTRLFDMPWLPVRAMRGLGLWAVGNMPPLKRFFMRHAMGIVGDLPECVRKQV